MTTNNRWMKRLIAEAAACKTRMPWERGLRRDALIKRRKGADAVAASATRRATA